MHNDRMDMKWKDVMKAHGILKKVVTYIKYS